MFHRQQVNWQPADHAETHHIDKHIHKGDIPGVFVTQYVGTEDLKCAHVLRRFLAVFGLQHHFLFRHHLCQRRQTFLARRTLTQHQYANGEYHRHAGRYNVAGALPVLGAENGECGADDRGDNSAADVMGNVPERPYAATLTAREPVRNSNKRGADPHTLKQAVQDNQRSEDPECGTES
ncbi:Uncharacterised protein [Klebsiella pneumoniae]|nr:Uncharacterised protein [Klebsiella pneumoniae]